MAHPSSTIYSSLRGAVKVDGEMQLRTGIVTAKLVWIGLVVLLQTGCLAPTPPPNTKADARVDIGALLFNDPRLGADGRTSCAGCHNPALAFTDGRALSIGAFGRAGTRNAPSLLGVSDRGPQFWDGRADTLTAAVMQPFTNPREMGHDSIAPVLARIAAQPAYRAVLGEQIDASEVAAALVAYLRSLDGTTSTFDRARASGDYTPLGADAQRGLRLFAGKAQCGGCHLLAGHRPSFSDGQFHHASVGFNRIAGNIHALQQRLAATRDAGLPLGRVILEDSDIAELGRFAVTSRPQDLGAFRTPSLRNVARTAPYMHDGSLHTLEAAIEHELYYRGLASGEPIKLTVEEQRELGAFLRTLDTP